MAKAREAKMKFEAAILKIRISPASTYCDPLETLGYIETSWMQKTMNDREDWKQFTQYIQLRSSARSSIAKPLNLL